MIAASIFVFIGQLDHAGVDVIGQLPSGLPPLANLGNLDVDLIGRLSIGALAVGAIGLVETTAIARSVSAQTGQRLHSDQEFVGQGLANIASGLFSGYPAAGSFSRTAVNFRAGAKTPLAAIFSSLFVLIALFAIGGLAAYLPRSALAAVLIITAYGMIDRAEISRIWRGTRGDAAIMLVTFLGTLFLHIEFAVLAGILFSLARYILRTSAPRVNEVLPDRAHKHFTYQPEKSPCPQLGIIDILGDLYFGAVNHVEEAILAVAARHPEQRFLLIRMHSVNHCDFSGIHMLESVVRTYRDRGGDVFIVRAGSTIRKVMASTGFDKFLEEDHFMTEETSISWLFHKVLDPAVCIYECPVRVFKECQNLPKRNVVGNVPLFHEVVQEEVNDIKPKHLWHQLQREDKSTRPFIVDVREPREFRQGHIPRAQLVPLPYILQERIKLPTDRPVVLACRSGRRSRRAAYALQGTGCVNISILEGGMLAWEAADLLLAVN
jgi:SulP family sulfate permease